MRLAEALYALLRLLPPEEAHRAGLLLLGLLPRRRREAPPELSVETWLGRLAPPIGLAAGFDKTGLRVAGLASLGFGYVVAGSVTLEARAGNRKPRIVRMGGGALVNAMGLPNPGVDSFARNLARTASDVPLVASIAGSDPSEIHQCYLRLRGVANAVEVNLSSPSLSGAAAVWSEARFKELAELLRGSKWCPLALKVPPLARHDLRDHVVRAVKVWADAGFEGVTAVNTLPVPEPRLSTGFGGLSGRPLKRYMLETVRALRGLVGGLCEINAVGGIFTADDALEAFKAGASTVQLYTALVYRGPGVVREMVKGLVEALRRMGVGSLEELRPQGP